MACDRFVKFIGVDKDTEPKHFEQYKRNDLK